MFLKPLTVIYLALIVPFVLFITLRLYSYPAWKPGCQFPKTNTGFQAPFRLLIFADPQLEGNTSLRRYRTHHPDTSLKKRLISDFKVGFYNARKRLDLWGNDRYLRHIQKTLRRHVDATHLTVLGDLLGSQWIHDDEFNARADRFWNVVFEGLEMVKPEDIADVDGNEPEVGKVDWSKKLILVAGNHDIGYSGDMSVERLERFENRFGPTDALFTLRFGNSSSGIARDGGVEVEEPSLQIVNLNCLTLDEPQLYPRLAEESYNFIETVTKKKSHNSKQATVLLTHVPFHKPPHLCNDGPFIDYFPEKEGGGVKEQNFLSETTSHYLLQQMFDHPLGEGKADASSRGIILTGHDHVGCDSTHYYKYTDPSGWKVVPTPFHKALRGLGNAGEEAVREITVTSMMGDYGGNAGFLSAWFQTEGDKGEGKWVFDYSSCMAGHPVLWWGVHVVDLIMGGVGVVLGLCWLFKLSKKAPAVADEKKNQ